MNEPPSHELVRQLTELQLCHPSDLRRAKGRVRRLSYDLPAFDSVWIDSLVQLRLLTPYQAQQIEGGRAEQLRIGSFVAVDELGRGTQGATFLVQRLNRRDRCVLKQLRIAGDDQDSIQQRMQFLLERAQKFVHPNLVMPNEVIPSSDRRLMTISRFVPGLPLNELLIRRGRFPASVVMEIGRQLLDGLSSLHSRSLIHGDIRMTNVRLTEQGLAVLVDGGIRPVVHPEMTIHSDLALEAYDGIAPELIGTGQEASASSELYSLGCLLWQLLAGRPPFTTADPLAKLAAHQTQRIEDVRAWAPDTPAVLAETIRQMTSPVPQERPRSFDEVLQRWRRPTASGRSRVRQFRRLFDGGASQLMQPSAPGSTSSRAWIAALFFAISGAVVMLSDGGMRTAILNVARQTQSIATQIKQSSEISTGNQADLRQPVEEPLTGSGRVPLPLPKPDDQGVILLSQPGPYEATQLIYGGELTIRGAQGIRPEILIGTQALYIRARSVTLEQVRVRQSTSATVPILVTIRSQRLNVRNCEFMSSNQSEDEQRPTSTNILGALGWSPNDVGTRTGQIEISNSSFLETGSAILLAQTPHAVEVVNTLKTGSGALALLGPKCIEAETKFSFDRVTLRETGPLLQMSGVFASKTSTPAVKIRSQNCVFKLADIKMGLITADTESPREDLSKSLVMEANETVIAPGTILLSAFHPAKRTTREIDADEQFEGLTANDFVFQGKDLHKVSDSKIARLSGPRIASAALPGIDPSQLGLTQ